MIISNIEKVATRKTDKIKEKIKMGSKIIKELQKDYKESMLEKDSLRVGLVQMVRANIQNFIRDNKLTEDTVAADDVITIIGRELKQQKDSLEAFEKGGREDLANETKVRIIILESYMPKQLTEDEIKTIIKETLEELDIENMTNKERGLLMKNLMPKVKGKADGKLVNKIIESIVNQ